MTITDKHIEKAAVRFSGNKSGASAVEFAVVAPVFIALLIGAMNFGYAFYALNSVQNIAIEASRTFSYGALSKSAAETAAEQNMRQFGAGFTVSITDMSPDSVSITVRTRPENLELIPFPGMSVSSWYAQGEMVEVVYKTPSYRITGIGQ